MPAYIIADVNVTDPEAYKEYVALVPGTIAAYGGEYLARGGKVEVVEGQWTPGRFVIVKFESVARAKEWLDSEMYGPVKAIRHRTALSNVLLVEGL